MQTILLRLNNKKIIIWTLWLRNEVEIEVELGWGGNKTEAAMFLFLVVVGFVLVVFETK